MMKQNFVFTVMFLIGIALCLTNSFGDAGSEAVTDPSLILYLSFDELDGTRAIDHSQHGNHGTVVGNRQLVAGRFGKALTFNGVSDWVEIPHHDSLAVDTSVTVMAWINTPRSHGPNGAMWQGIIAKDNDLRPYNVYTGVGDYVHLSIGNGVNNPCCVGSASERTFALNTWQHVAAQLDSNGVHRFWINGERAGNFQLGGTLPGLADTASVLVGKTHENDREFLGMIDEVRVWNRALSEAEILEQMAIGYGSGELRFSPNEIADQTFTVGTPVNLTLPTATGGTPPYGYSLAPQLPAGLWFDPIYIGGTPTAALPATPFTYTATDATGASASLTFTITVQDTSSLADVYMYWTDAEADKIQRANLDGTNIQDLITTGLVDPESIALDISTGKMYWTDTAGGKIQRANLDGTNVEDIPIPGLSLPDGLALDLAAGKIYWSDNGTDKIRRANLDGTNAEDLVVTGVADPDGLTLDLVAGKIYWTEWVLAKIRRANLDGTNPEDVLTTGLINPDGIALDLVDSKMYWTDAGRSTISRANLNGTNVEDLVTTGLARPDGIALDLVDGKMYWTDFMTDKIQRANLDGSHVEDLITTGLSTPKRIALGIPQTPVFRLNPNVIDDQTFTVGTAVNLTLPVAIGGTPPYGYSLAPAVPAGLYFDPIANGPGFIGGTPTAAMPSTLFTYTASDATGASAALTFTITVSEDGGLNLDVNGDGKVDVLDLVWVAVSYGMRGEALPADVNADGVVNVQDLVAVAGGIDATAVLPAKIAEEVLLAAEAAEIDGVAGAPVMGFSSRSKVVSGLTAHRNVAVALSDARSLAGSDARLAKWLPLLEELLQQLAELQAIPEATALLPNYPNPFNPETWIPYHLSTDAAVTVTIYDVRGSVVRELLLGHQPSGVYESRGRAAYWDGRNQIGEPVASGLYFYTLTAGEFNATRKLLIAK